VIAPAALPVFALLVVAPTGPDDGCPSARQVTEAMQARFPSSVLPADPASSQPGWSATRPDVLRAILDIAPDGTVVRFSLIDARGDTQLRRTLPAPGRGRPPSDCVALADTLAAIVERYLGFISYESSEADVPIVRAPAASPAPSLPAAPAAPVALRPRAGLVLVGAGWRMVSEGQSAPEGRVGAVLELTRSPRRVAGLLTVGVSPGVSGSFTRDGQMRNATLRRFPARVGALLELPAGPGLIEPALELGVDLLVLSLANGPESASFGVDTGVDAAVGYRLPMTRSLYVKPKAAIGLMIVRHNVFSDENSQPVFQTPRATASFGIETGVIFQ
jgi:hypothetical protein